MVLTACSERRIIPSPAPTPTARPLPPSPPPPPRPTSGIDWRDMPITPGEWRWSSEAGQSVARFAGGALVLRCDPASRTVSLQRQGSARGTVAMTLVTSYGNRQLSAAAQPGSPPMLSASFAGGDPVLDTLAFSRGRFAIETTGLQTLYVPSWPEISRVVQDCR